MLEVEIPAKPLHKSIATFLMILTLLISVAALALSFGAPTGENSGNGAADIVGP